MKNENLLQKNLSVLARSSPAAARLIKESQISVKKFQLQAARNESPIAAELIETRWYTLHSSMNPEKEAERAAERHKGDGYLICFGLGAGYYLNAALKIVTPLHGGILLIDDNPERLRFLLSNFDYTRAFAYKGFRMLVNPVLKEIEQAVTDFYLPGLYGNLGVLPLQSIASRRRDRLQSITETIQQTLEGIKTDFSVQVHFGKLWFDNLTSNLSFITEKRCPALHTLQEKITGRKVYITGAGPGLNIFLDKLSDRPDDSILLATDTSLPVLLTAGITPDAVINVDCQFYSVLHTCTDHAATLPWIVPVTASPALIRLLKNPYFYAGGHPLERWLASRVALPLLDTSGGNVLHTAVSLARLSGAAEISIYGADFSNSGGIPYATESYIYRWFSDRAKKTSPLHSKLLRFTFDSRETISTECLENTPYNTAYPAPRLSHYRYSFERILSNTQTKVIMHSTDGFREFPGKSSDYEPQLLNMNPRVTSTAEIITEIFTALKETSPIAPALLYPLAAWFRGNNKVPEKIGADEVLSVSRAYAEKRLLSISDKE